MLRIFPPLNNLSAGITDRITCSDSVILILFHLIFIRNFCIYFHASILSFSDIQVWNLLWPGMTWRTCLRRRSWRKILWRTLGRRLPKVHLSSLKLISWRSNHNITVLANYQFYITTINFCLIFFLCPYFYLFFYLVKLLALHLLPILRASIDSPWSSLLFLYFSWFPSFISLFFVHLLTLSLSHSPSLALSHSLTIYFYVSLTHTTPHFISLPLTSLPSSWRSLLDHQLRCILTLKCALGLDNGRDGGSHGGG